MPELPEVETVARDLRELVGSRIAGVLVYWERTIASPGSATFIERLKGRQIEQVGRRGKWILIHLSPSGYLLVHLRMSGRLLIDTPGTQPDKYTRVLLTLDDGRQLHFSDVRKFGRMVLTDDPDEVLGDLGPEPLDPDFTADVFQDMLASRRARLKPLLLNQRFLVGLGNIYADEALWHAGIHPLRRSDTLTPEEVIRLHRAIQEVLEEAIAAEGTTLRDAQYVGADGREGQFARRLAAYAKTGEECPRCKTAIERIVVGQRGTHFCPHCQQELGH
jgi:formamidopyrimidine-DNA glycosylase